MTDEDLVNAVRYEFSHSLGLPGGEIAKERDLAWARYTRQMLGNEIEGESQVVTSDVQEVMDGMLAGLMRIFAQADNLCVFEPNGPEDVKGAEQETEFVTHVFWKDNPHSFVQLFFWMFNCLYAKVGVAMAWWDDSQHVTEEDWEGLTPEKIEEMTVPEGQDRNLTMIPVLRSDPYQKPVMTKDPATGQEVETQVEVFDVVFRRVEMKRRASWQTVPPEHFRISADADGPYTSCGSMRGIERLVTRSKLVQMGFDQKFVWELPAANVASASSTARDPSRPQETQQQQLPSGAGSTPGKDRSREEVLYQMAYIEIDVDGDGIAELRQVHMAGGKLLKWADGRGPAKAGGFANMMVHRDPFHVLIAHPLPHQFFGRAPADDEVGTQEITTTLLRQTLNNLYRTNNPMHGVAEYGLSESTMDDLATQQIGGTVRFARNPNEVYAQMAVPFTAQNSFGMLDYFDQKKFERHGIHGTAEALDVDALKNIQKTVMNSAMDIREEKRLLVASFFAETGIKSLLLHLHELVLRHQDQKRVFRLRNEWVDVDIQQWRHRSDMTANIGVGFGTRDQQSLMLEKVSDMQIALRDAGMGNLVVKPKHLYNTAVEITKLARIADPNRHFADPGDALMPPPDDQQQEFQRQQQELQARQQQLDAERQQNQSDKHDLARQRLELDHKKAIAQMEESREKRLDQWALENEKLRNEIAELRVKQIDSDEDREIKKARTDAEIDEIKARAAQARAQAMKTAKEAESVDIENDAVRSGITDLVENFAKPERTESEAPAGE